MRLNFNLLVIVKIRPDMQMTKRKENLASELVLRNKKYIKNTKKENQK